MAGQKAQRQQQQQQRALVKSETEIYVCDLVQTRMHRIPGQYYYVFLRGFIVL